MAEAELIDRLREGFSQYTLSPEKLTTIRSKIAAHVQSFANSDACQNSNDIPPHVRGLRLQLLQAAQANRKATERLLSLQRQPIVQDDDNVTDTFFASHLDVSKLRKQHQDYQVISHYASSLQDLADRERVLDVQPSYEPGLLGEVGVTVTTTVSEEVDDLTRNLESALLRMNYQLQRERHLLEKARSKPSKKVASARPRFHALRAVHTELTEWVENSLSRCDDAEEETDDTSELADRAVQGNDLEIDIDEAYMRYCNARERVMLAATALSEPLPEIKNETPDIQNVIRAPMIQVLPMIEAQYLPLWKESKIAHQQLSFISEAIFRHGQQLTEKLNRLQDESHLLPAYPLLKRGHQSLRSTTDSSDTNPEHARMLEAWQFANEAAQITTSESIMKQSSEGHDATNAAVEILKRMKSQTDMWQQLSQRQG